MRDRTKGERKSARRAGGLHGYAGQQDSAAKRKSQVWKNSLKVSVAWRPGSAPGVEQALARLLWRLLLHLFYFAISLARAYTAANESVRLRSQAQPHTRPGTLFSLLYPGPAEDGRTGWRAHLTARGAQARAPKERRNRYCRVRRWNGARRGARRELLPVRQPFLLAQFIHATGAWPRRVLCPTAYLARRRVDLRLRRDPPRRQTQLPVRKPPLPREPLAQAQRVAALCPTGRARKQPARRHDSQPGYHEGKSSTPTGSFH